MGWFFRQSLKEKRMMRRYFVLIALGLVILIALILIGAFVFPLLGIPSDSIAAQIITLVLLYVIIWLFECFFRKRSKLCETQPSKEE